MIGPVPHWKPNLPTLMFRNNQRLDKDQQYLFNHALKDVKDLDSTLYMKTKDLADVRYYSALKFLCKIDECMTTTMYNGTIMPVIWDEAHLTDGGAVLMSNQLYSN